MNDERPGREAWGGVRWGSPQVLLPLLACLFAAVYALRSAPPASAPAPSLTMPAASAEESEVLETSLYAVDEDGLAHPIVVELAAPEERSARLQGIVEALRAEMMRNGSWPPALPAPHVHAFRLERRQVAVLDLPAADVPLDVAAERSILASLERTLLEQGVERIAYLRDGRAEVAWLGHIATPSGFD